MTEKGHAFGWLCHQPLTTNHYDLTDTKLPGSDNGPINARVVFVHADHGLHKLGVGFGRVRVEIDHHTTLIPHDDADGRTGPLGAKFQDLAHPSIFLEWPSALGVDHEVRPETTDIRVVARFARDAPDGSPGDRGNPGLVEGAMTPLNELHLGP